MTANFIPAFTNSRQATAIAMPAAAAQLHEMPVGDLIAGLAGRAE